METTPAECSVLFAGSTDRDDRSKMSRVAASPTDRDPVKNQSPKVKTF